MIDYTCPVCLECEREASCNFPCLDYSNYRIRQHMEKESNNIQNTIKTLRNDISQSHKPPVARVVEDDISDRTGVLRGLGLNDEKKEMLKKMLNENQGVCIIPDDACLPKKYNENDIENFLEYNVEDVEWLRVINGQIPYTELIDKHALVDYLKSENEKYCSDNYLCETYRSPLKEFQEIEAGMISEVYWACPHRC